MTFFKTERLAKTGGYVSDAEKQAWTHDLLPSHAAGPPQPWSGWPGELGEPSAHGEPGELGEPGPLSLLGKAGLKK